MLARLESTLRKTFSPATAFLSVLCLAACAHQQAVAPRAPTDASIPARIAFYIQRLGDPHYVEYNRDDGELETTLFVAAEELGKIGAPAIPALIERLQATTKPYEKQQVFYALNLAAQAAQNRATAAQNYQSAMKDLPQLKDAISKEIQAEIAAAPERRRQNMQRSPQDMKQQALEHSDEIQLREQAIQQALDRLYSASIVGNDWPKITEAWPAPQLHEKLKAAWLAWWAKHEPTIRAAVGKPKKDQ
jgi:hypothetical protein